MKMRSLLLGAVAGLCITAFGTSSADAQVYTAFSNTIVNKPFTLLPSGRTVLPADNFRVGQTPGTIDHDDGYYYSGSAYGIQFNNINGGTGFTFEFDGRRYTSVNINVNGFVSFGNTLFLGSNQPENLFRKDAPNTIAAPYWGDHFYREVGEIGFIPSEISVNIATVTDEITNDPIRVLTVQWKDLNVNYNFDPADPNNALSPNKAPQPSSVGTFQMKLYESPAVNAPKRGKQGDIEFHYSTVGDPRVPGVVKTSGAALGLESHAPVASAGQTTFMNGLFIEDPNYPDRIPGRDVPDSVRMSRRLSSTWAPSRANNNVIVFNATPQPGISGWGDGDANLSQLDKHFGMAQNRFVTASDVVTIMRAVAKSRPLDPLRFRGAYHGDVNHNGRYYYSTRNYNNTGDSVVGGRIVTYRVNITTRSNNEFDNLPADNSLTDIYYEANEYDAGLIMAYMAGKVPVLPWLIDTIVEYGKVGVVKKADGLLAPIAVQNGNGTYKLPLYLNGSLNGALGVVFDLNGTVQSVETIGKEDADVQYVFDGNRVVFAGKGNFAANELIGYVVVSSSDKEIELSNLRFNDNEKGSMKIQVAGENVTTIASNYPNPVVDATSIQVTIPVDGQYSVVVYDMLGNKVKTLSNGVLAAGNQTFTWDATDVSGQSVSAGMYIYRIDGNGLHIAKQMNVVR